MWVKGDEVITSLEQKKKLIELLKGKNPSYTEILGFYEKVIEAQDAEKAAVSVATLHLHNNLKSLQTSEGFPLIDRKDFILDIPSGVLLFESLCRISRNANEKMRENIQAIEEASAINALNLRELLRRHSDESYLNSIAEEFSIDKAILLFLVNASIQPSLNENAEQLKDQVDLKNWLKGYCPVCGSSPQISELKDEGRRFFLCSFCRFQWPSERLKCPYCENADHEKLQYLYEEGQEAYRVDVCDNCKQYIKTVDARKLDYEPDLPLEDIMTIHLDILASEKGYKRPVPNLWGF
jgi:FdhE protein